MKKIKKLTVVAIVTVLFLALSGAAFGQTYSDNGTIDLSGTVAVVFSLTAVADAQASSLPLDEDRTDLSVGTVTETSNVYGGYTVTLESANGVANSSGAYFESSTAGNTDTLTYDVSYGGTPVDLSGDGAAEVTTNAGKSAAGGDSKTVAITFSGASANLYAGTYEDTLTFTIESNL